MDKKKIIIPIIILVLILIIILFGLKQLLGKHLKTYDRYIASIIVETTKKGEETKTMTTLDLKDDGKVAIVNTSFKEYPLYITKKGVLFESGGRFRRIKSEYTYRDIYAILNEIDFEKKDGSYHPNIKTETINKLLDSLFIDYEMTRDTVGNITVKDQKIEEFSVYLRGFYGYEKLGIIVMFENMSDQYKIESPMFYENLIDDGDEAELRFVD